MNTTVKSLQDAYVSLGGEITDTYEDIDNGTPVSDYTTIPDVIEAIAQIAAKTLELPKTTSADKGSVLMVNEEGNWDKGEVPSNDGFTLIGESTTYGGNTIFINLEESDYTEYVIALNDPHLGINSVITANAIISLGFSNANNAELNAGSMAISDMPAFGLVLKVTKLTNGYYEVEGGAHGLGSYNGKTAQLDHNIFKFNGDNENWVQIALTLTGMGTNPMFISGFPFRVWAK